MAGVWQGINYQNSPLSGFIGKFNNLNQVNFAGSPAAVINLLMPYVFVLAGIILFSLILWSGLIILTSFGDDSKMSSAKKTLTNAAIGFMIIFVSYWLLLIIKLFFGAGV